MNDGVGGELGHEEPGVGGERGGLRDAPVVQFDEGQLSGEAGPPASAAETLSADDSGDGEVEPDDNLRSFGETVKASRRRAGLTQEQLARLIGYSVQYVGSVEQGRRHPSQKFINKTDSVLNAFGVIIIAARQLSRRRGLASWFRRWAELEEVAVTLNTYECRSIPGLLMRMRGSL
ncbi:helix-turn-helix transcriptional regulator [Streptomyces sp. NPDC097617]|uniref:helix-turn-helix transcriptional regulator n=1 Tax=Streptomyces sp. NPDC097617 TaxID=3366091 RepID=UPI0037F1DA4C